eukprot:3148326-Alexandrium_andersonii.AAC.1
MCIRDSTPAKPQPRPAMPLLAPPQLAVKPPPVPAAKPVGILKKKPSGPKSLAELKALPCKPQATEELG